ncbi:hypothetical protein Tco_1255010 [Tanacetum coccineum]
MSAHDDFSLHDDEELSLHDDASLAGSLPASNKGDAPAKPPQIITTNTLSNIKLPVLQKDDYDTWAMEMEHYLEYIDNEVWKVIQNGNSKKRVTKGKDGVYRVLPPTTQEEQFADEKERKARTLLLMAVPKDHLRRFHGMDDAKEIWAAIKTSYAGRTVAVKLLSQLDALGASVSDEDANHKFLRSLPPAWDSLAMTMRTKKNIDTLSIDDLYNNLSPKLLQASTKTKPKLKEVNKFLYTSFPTANTTATPGLADEVIHSFLATNADDVDLIHEDLDQIDDLDLEEMDINWQIAMTAIKIKKFYKKTGRRPRVDGKMHVAFDKRKVECFKLPQFGGHFAWNASLQGSKEVAGRKQVRGQGFQKPVRTVKVALYGPLMKVDHLGREVYQLSPKCLMQVPMFSPSVHSHDSVGELGTVLAMEAAIKKHQGVIQANVRQAYKALDLIETGCMMYVYSWYKMKSVVPRGINTGKQNVNSGRVHVNTARVTSPVLTNQTSQGTMGTAVKTSAGCVWRKTTLHSNINSGPTPDSNIHDHPLKHMEHRGIFDSGCSGHIDNVTGASIVKIIKIRSKVGSVTFGGCKGSFSVKDYATDVSLLPTTFWAEESYAAIPSKALVCHTLILSYINNLGALCLLNTLSPLGKFDGKSDEGFLVGYSVNSKAFRVYNLVTKRVEVNLHVNFLEEKPNVQGLGHRWMFDLDYLTDSMNYIPVSLQNQANPAGSKENSMLPSETQMLQRKGVTPQRSQSSTPISKSADDIMVFRKELDALALKHLGPVPTKTPTSTNPVNTGSSDFNTGDEQVSPGHIEAVAPSAHNVEEVFSDDDDDEMPEIRIYDKSSEGIFEQASYDDDGLLLFSTISLMRIEALSGKSLRLIDSSVATSTSPKKQSL